jgi:hypothetical protein
MKKKKTVIYAHSAFKYVEVHRVTSRRDDGGIFETEFIGFAERRRAQRKGEVVAPLSQAAMATIAAAQDEGLTLEVLVD